MNPNGHICLPLYVDAQLPVRMVAWYPCYDPSRGMHMPPAGQCNSSHGGSCCCCGGPLPVPHIHLNTNGIEEHDWGAGGNVCSEGCMIFFMHWLATGPHILKLCPGHGIEEFPHNGWANWGNKTKSELLLTRTTASGMPECWDYALDRPAINGTYTGPVPGAM